MSGTRIASLDFLRGVAVMGILVANLPAFALPRAAYFSPLAWGGTAPADIAVWFATFVLVEGKLRGLFSFLFGASLLLVIDRACDDAAGVHFRRMAVLFAIGCAHLYLVWWGDILAHYALVGALAYMARRLSVRWLVALGLGVLAWTWIGDVVGTAILWRSAARATPAMVATWDAFAASFGVPPRPALLAEIAATRGDWADALAWRWRHATGPLVSLTVVGPETMSAVLLGMAGYRSGFLTGTWPRARYRRWAVACLAPSLIGYAILGLATLAHGFDQRWVFLGSVGASPPLRTLGFVGYAALLVPLAGDGWWTARVAAAGRAAFTNYLATSVLMTAIFYGWGLGQFAAWPRATLTALVPIAWAGMLLWSKPWLDRRRYGPLEWLWRSLARGRPQPMRYADRSRPPAGA
ncbi:DUF418 domain-containing protein [Sphingomonas rubra]|uniref:DUF418 domain-containing protein n=1 Tax=Sphingomonas rubra TaxID=634430 RepID=A0A1I5QWB8_9SPHN|nr:DUF418 domain-containing protein [Sphingomonas rubra]SFP50522.1 uncharacterized protein SAMN04488241_102336 [Sphingomonas rubra]